MTKSKIIFAILYFFIMSIIGLPLFASNGPTHNCKGVGVQKVKPYKFTKSQILKYKEDKEAYKKAQELKAKHICPKFRA